MTEKRMVIILNPSAGEGKAFKKKGRLEKMLKDAGVSHDLYVSESEEDLRRVTRGCTKEYRTIVGAGGDTTFFIMINEIKRHGDGVRFGMIGLGSSNDIAREFGMHSMKRACLALKTKRSRPVDLGCIVDDGEVIGYFLGQANIGLGVEVNRAVEDLLRRGSALARSQTAAGISAIRQAFRDKSVPLPLIVESEAGKAEGHFVSAVFSNIRYWASGKKIFPEALTDDGKLDTFLIRSCTFRQLVSLALSAYRGKQKRSKLVDIRNAAEFQISSEPGFEIQTDGEILKRDGYPLRFNRLQIKADPKALTIIC